MLKFEGIVWIDEIVEKISSIHRVSIDEVEEILYNSPQIRFIEKGNRKDEDVYIALGKTNSGRYLAVLFIYKPEHKEVLILSARDMAQKEKRLYGKTKKR
ncbi:MAG: BrnT family toxin [Ignavibacteriaceae bacterium]